MTIHVRELSEARFSTMAGDWQRCLSWSDADPLFMSWPWLYSWWETWSQILGLNLLLLGAFDEEDRLVGLGPFYTRYLETPVGLRVKRLHLLGNAWRIEPTVRSEYCSLIALRDDSQNIQSAIFDYLAEEPWDELVLCDITSTELDHWKQMSGRSTDNLQYVVRSTDRGVRVNTSEDFDRWKRELGKNTRLKAFNRRRYLRELGALHLEAADSDVGFDAFFSALNQFHQRRWGKPAFDDLALRFHRRFVSRLSDDMRARCISLYHENQCISVLYDVEAGQGRYNLQSGYLEDFDAKLSLGTLHLGYAIEDSFLDSACRYYDLLAGSGKSTHYKSHFRGETVRFSTVQLVRHSIMQMIYRGQATLPQRFRQKLNQYLKL